MLSLPSHLVKPGWTLVTQTGRLVADPSGLWACWTIRGNRFSGEVTTCYLGHDGRWMLRVRQSDGVPADVELAQVDLRNRSAAGLPEVLADQPKQLVSSGS